MGEARQLDRATIEQAFGLMGQYLLDRQTLGEIVIYRWVNRTQQALSAYRSAKQRIKALRAKNGS